MTRIRKTYGFTIPPEVYMRFKEKCGLIPMSRQIEVLMKQWIGEDEGANVIQPKASEMKSKKGSKAVSE